jgi:hypothetical protein
VTGSGRLRGSAGGGSFRHAHPVAPALDLSRNRIRRLPPELGWIRAQDLDLSHNQLRTTDQLATTFLVTGPAARAGGLFRVRTVTPPHAHNANLLQSAPTPAVAARPRSTRAPAEAPPG